MLKEVLESWASAYNLSVRVHPADAQQRFMHILCETCECESGTLYVLVLAHTKMAYIDRDLVSIGDPDFFNKVLEYLTCRHTNNK